MEKYLKNWSVHGLTEVGVLEEVWVGNGILKQVKDGMFFTAVIVKIISGGLERIKDVRVLP